MVLIKRYFLFFTLLFVSIASVAQPGGGGDPGGGEPVPLSGIWFLLVAGVALGIRKLRIFNDRQKE